METAELMELFLVSYNLMNSRQYESAIRSFETFIPRAKGSFGKAMAFMNCGVCYFKLDNFDDARIYFNQAVKLKPDFAVAFYNRGLMYTHIGELESAIRDYDRAVEIQPDFANAFYEKGYCLTVQNNLEGALACFKRASDIVPDNALFLENTGKLYLMLENSDEALKYFLRQVCASQNDVEAHVNIARCYRVKDDFIAAINSVNAALKIDKNYARAYEEMGTIMCAAKQFAHAVVDFCTALKLSKDLSIIEKLCVAVRESNFFRHLANDCILAREGRLSIDELVSRIDAVVQKS